jgi:hypothetical protein
VGGGDVSKNKKRIKGGKEERRKGKKDTFSN